ncbi:TadE-like protein [Brevibacterium iodinum ATCC 49514]|uniref:TadE-like protein n=1 Tax=Brevibacterium iodinum ATCC 49514 TaxID=1255616 RepID=A0A2H1KEI5_9MICO|nr:TadE/TadG family type IV pilus assembly protein [Brevibacterium iodinum]SMX98150.1 TadE-like protein [Brevibacterium iodinum ATCC 49514]SUW13274.1 TadE-like protein [Brevibacterium iodinum]
MRRDDDTERGDRLGAASVSAAGERSDAGSAVAEFALIASLLALILAGALQIGLVIHVRNTVIDSAIAGARQASLADQTPRDGQKLTRDLIRVSVGERYAQKVTVSTSKHGAVEIVEVQVTTPLPVIGLWGPAEIWELRGRSIVEDIDRD